MCVNEISLCSCVSRYAVGIVLPLTHSVVLDSCRWKRARQTKNDMEVADACSELAKDFPEPPVRG